MKELTCIICPTGCTLQIDENNGDISVSGGKCKRGEPYAIQEMTNPLRSLQSTIKTTVPGYRRVAVKTSDLVPLKDIFIYMDEINKITLTQKKKCGEIISYGLNGSDVNLILTERMN